ncbi:DUF2489 domain-containing protein [Marinimicrobium alkaliphilum]|uniref:DUF2489 domain-containing protein n=1 Tax=Marinimicrobium alkaliphilum TaxID=2202654 RepID=UPI000DB9B497|nr:DUF2489 domain-containing protein [Marinimicrobium alkaliphilum]
MTLTTTLIILAVIIILALAGVAGWLHYKLHRQNQQHQAVQEQQAKAGREQRARVNQSIQILARAVGNDEELTLTEASIRISVLLDSLGVEDPVREEFSAFYQLTEATSHIPFLEGWKQLSRQEQVQYDRERETQETQYREFVLEAAERIQGRDF